MKKAAIKKQMEALGLLWIQLEEQIKMFPAGVPETDNEKAQYRALEKLCDARQNVRSSINWLKETL